MSDTQTRNEMRLGLAQRASKILGVSTTRALALMLTYEEAQHTYDEDQRVDAARAVLYWHATGINGRMMVGQFEAALLLLWSRADDVNKDRLAIAFPAMADALDIWKMYGREGLQLWTEGRFTDEQNRSRR